MKGGLTSIAVNIFYLIDVLEFSFVKFIGNFSFLKTILLF